MLRRRTFLKVAVAAAVTSAVPRSLLSASAIACPSNCADLRFSLLYKGDKIGTHVVRSVSTIEGTGVNTEIEMTVKKFFLTVFSYSHRSEESWRDGRLMALKSETTESGATFRVEGAAVPTGFRVVGQEGPFVAPAGSLTSNCLWNAAILQQVTVIDAQHGGVIGLSVRKLVDERIVIAGLPVAATRFRLITPDLAGTIWYDEQGRWVSGELERYGAKLAYRLEP